MKKYFSLLLGCIMMLMSVVPIHAEEEPNINDEWYEMVFEEENISSGSENIISPQTQYIMGVQTSIQKRSSSQVALHAEVYCNQSVKSIVTIFSLQKLSNGSWKTVSSGTTSVSNTARLSKSAIVSGVSSGTYRAKTTTRVVDSNGYSETLTGYSGSITI